MAWLFGGCFSVPLHASASDHEGQDVISSGRTGRPLLSAFGCLGVSNNAAGAQQQCMASLGNSVAGTVATTGTHPDGMSTHSSASQATASGKLVQGPCCQPILEDESVHHRDLMPSLLSSACTSGACAGVTTPGSHFPKQHISMFESSGSDLCDTAHDLVTMSFTSSRRGSRVEHDKQPAASTSNAPAAHNPTYATTSFSRQVTASDSLTFAPSSTTYTIIQPGNQTTTHMSTAGDSYFTRLSSRLQGNSEDVLTVSLAGNTAWEGDTVDTNTHGGAGCTSAGDEPLREQLLQHQPSFQLLASVEVVELSCLAAGKHSSQKAPGETTASSTSTTSDDQPCVLLSREPTEDSATWRSVLDHLTSSGLAGDMPSDHSGRPKRVRSHHNNTSRSSSNASSSAVSLDVLGTSAPASLAPATGIASSEPSGPWSAATGHTSKVSRKAAAPSSLLPLPASAATPSNREFLVSSPTRPPMAGTTAASHAAPGSKHSTWQALARQQAQLRKLRLAQSYSTTSLGLQGHAGLLAGHKQAAPPRASAGTRADYPGFHASKPGMGSTAQQTPKLRPGASCTYIRVTEDQKQVVYVPKSSCTASLPNAAGAEGSHRQRQVYKL